MSAISYRPTNILETQISFGEYRMDLVPIGKVLSAALDVLKSGRVLHIQNTRILSEYSFRDVGGNKYIVEDRDLLEKIRFITKLVGLCVIQRYEYQGSIDDPKGDICLSDIYYELDENGKASPY